jgi:hypothetical protein
MPCDPRAEALCAAFLCWTAVLAARVLVSALTLGAQAVLAWSGGSMGLVVPVAGIEAGLSLLALWVGAWMLLRPGGLELGPFWRQPLVMPAATLVFLGVVAAQFAIPAARAMLLTRLLPIEVFAGTVPWTSGIWTAHAVLQAFSIAGVVVAIAQRSAAPPALH